MERGNRRWLTLRRLAVALVALTLITLPLATNSHASVANPQFDEWDFLNQINRDRRAEGLGPIAMLSGARDVARAWSGVMAQRNDLAHNPSFGSELRSRFPSLTAAAENVGVGGGAVSLHRAFMSSSGHRANIMGDYGYVGIGVKYSNDTLWVTQNFVRNVGSLPFLLRAPTSRVGGNSDTDTSVLLSRRMAAGSAGGVVIAGTGGFADGLAGAPLAAVKRGPLLLTPPNSAPSNLIEEAARVLRPGASVYLLGGPNAVSPAVEAQLRAAGLPVIRLAGADRYSTSTTVAGQVNPLPTKIFLASGVSFPDAVVAGAVAGSQSAPIILVAPTEVPPPAQAYLTTNPMAARTVIGGTAVISEAVALQTGADRVSGADRYSTSVAIANKFFPGSNRIALANGGRFEDALVASAEAGRDGFPVILTNWPVPNASYDYVGRQASRWIFVLAVGRPDRLNDSTLIQSLS